MSENLGSLRYTYSMECMFFMFLSYHIGKPVYLNIEKSNNNELCSSGRGFTIRSLEQPDMHLHCLPRPIHLKIKEQCGWCV